VSADFDVVIVAFDSRDTIASCVDHARRLSGVGEVVVVDHGHDGAGEVAHDAGARVLTDAANPGFGAGQNRGVGTTAAPYALLLNPDASPDDAGTQAGLRVLREHHSVGAVQGMITNRITGLPERSQGREIGPLHLVGRAVGARRLLRIASVRALVRRIGVLADHVDRVPTTTEPVASLAATAILVRRRAVDDVGGFDESYFLYGEDLDLCRRLRARGWTLVALPERSAWHEGGGSATTDTERELTWWRGTMRFSALWWSTPAWCIALLASMVQWCRLAARERLVARRAWRALVTEPVRDRRLR
jgi:GT2 family glycosyltransferase